MRIDFIDPSDSRWNEALGAAAEHDVYDLAEYAAVCGKYEGAAPIAFYASEGAQFCLIPLLQRPLPPSFGAPAAWSDATSPYGYSSALFVGDGEWPLRAVQAFVGTCAERDIISVFVRLHPLLSVPTAALDAAGIRVRHGNTVHMDLTLPEQALRDQQRSGHRYEIRRLHLDDFKVVVDDWSLYDRFVQLYWEAMRDLNADPYYLFPAGYFGDLRRSLGPRLHLLSVLAPDRSVAAAGLFTETQGIVQYHLSCTAEEHRRRAPSKLMLDYAITWAKSAGNHVLHLGGGAGSQADGLFRFKTGFSKTHAPFHTWRVICDPKRYSELIEAAGAFDVPPEGFFPAYRKPKDR